MEDCDNKPRSGCMLGVAKKPCLYFNHPISWGYITRHRNNRGHLSPGTCPRIPSFRKRDPFPGPPQPGIARRPSYTDSWWRAPGQQPDLEAQPKSARSISKTSKGIADSELGLSCNAGGRMRARLRIPVTPARLIWRMVALQYSPREAVSSPGHYEMGGFCPPYCANKGLPPLFSFSVDIVL